MSLADDARRLNLRTLHRHKRTGKPPHSRAPLPALILLTDEQRLADPSAVVARLPRGSAVIFRHYGLPDAERAVLARKLRAATRKRRILLLVAAKDEAANNLAQEIQADGVHLPEWRVRYGAWRGFRGRKPGWLITAAAHSLVATRRAALRGADAVLLSPVFATASHPGTRPFGALRFAASARISRIPVYALGGIDARSAARLRATNAWGLAAIGGLVNCRRA